MHEVWQTPVGDIQAALEANAELQARRHGGTYKRPLREEEQARHEDAMAFWRRQEALSGN